MSSSPPPLSTRLLGLLSRERHAKLCCGLVAGDPHIEALPDQLLALSRGGADLIEVIFPFSHPAVHGLVIQRACQRALREGVSFEQLVEQCQIFRQSSQTPLLVSSYMNRIIATGEEAFVAGAVQAGVDALLANDLPWALSGPMRALCARHGLLYVPAVAPSTPHERLDQMAHACAGGLGVWTGHLGGELIAHQRALETLREQAARHDDFSLLASMHVADASQARQAAALAGGVMVTSAIVWMIEGRGSTLNDRLEGFVREIRAELDTLRLAG